MNLPDKIIIDGVPVKILYFDNVNEVDKFGESRFEGQCNFKDCTMRILRGVRPVEAIWGTIWHEAFHYILSGFHGDFSNSDDEGLAVHFGSQLNKIMFDNGLMEARKTPDWGSWTHKGADSPFDTETLPKKE